MRRHEEEALRISLRMKLTEQKEFELRRHEDELNALIYTYDRLRQDTMTVESQSKSSHSELLMLNANIDMLKKLKSKIEHRAHELDQKQR